MYRPERYVYTRRRCMLPKSGKNTNVSSPGTDIKKGGVLSAFQNDSSNFKAELCWGYLCRVLPIDFYISFFSYAPRDI